MGPAIGVPWGGGLIPTQALTAAGRIQPHREPSVGWRVVEHNRITQGVVEGALTIALVRRVKVLPPSVETEAPEMLIGLKLRPRESL